MDLLDTVENLIPISSTSPHSPPSPSHASTRYVPSGDCQPNSGNGYPPMNHSNPEYNYYNSGGNVNGSGIQKNGDVKVRNHSPKTGLLNLGSIASNKGNESHQQLLGDVNIANIGH